jgi:hypothetical protein
MQVNSAFGTCIDIMAPGWQLFAAFSAPLSLELLPRDVLAAADATAR